MRKFGQVLLQIADNGCGIPEKQLQDLFKPFYTSKPHGTGLGLVIVRKMITRMHGKIEISSTTGQGTAVNISLPEGHDAA
jgi:signal transduction histidine kinase